MAPENPFPTAINDSVKVYRWILENGYNHKNIVFAGESAGGGLCLATLLALKEQSLPMPAATVAISPWTDLTCSGPSYEIKNNLSPAPINSWHVFAKHYAGNHPLNTPLISPLYGNLSGLPPLLINSGENDQLYNDGEQFAQKAQVVGIDVTFRKGEKQIHCYPFFAPLFPEATQAMTEIVKFIHYHLEI